MKKQEDMLRRLRSGFGGLVPPVCDEAANEIERLTALCDQQKRDNAALISRLARYERAVEPSCEHWRFIQTQAGQVCAKCGISASAIQKGGPPATLTDMKNRLCTCTRAQPVAANCPVHNP